MRRGLAHSTNIYILPAAHVQQAGNICSPHCPLLTPPPGCHTPPGGSAAVMALEYTGPTGLLSHGEPENLFQLWLGQPALPALCCLPLVLPAAWTVALCCGWLLLSTDTLLKLAAFLQPHLLLLLAGFPGSTLDLTHHARGCQ